MKKFILIVSLLFAFASFADMSEVWELLIKLEFPRIYDNTHSLGYRKYQHQLLVGDLYVHYRDGERPTFEVRNLYNKTYRISGKPVTYECRIADEMIFPRFNYVGNNKTGIFKTPTATFFLEAKPSYAKGVNPTEDNSLYILLSGIGTSAAFKHCECGKVVKTYKAHYLRGFVSGQVGCGCEEYGHTSPTRVAGEYGATDFVDDVCATEGKWKARLRTIVVR